MSRKFLYVIIAITFPVICRGQQKENLKGNLSYAQIINRKDDTSKVNLLNNQGREYYHKGKNDSALYLGKMSLALAQKLHYPLGEANANSLLGVVIFEFGKYTEAANYYFSALKIFEQLGTANVVAGMYNNIGNVYRRNKDYPNALRYQYEALKRHKKDNNIQGMARTYVGLAQIYKEQSQISKALTIYDSAIVILDSIQETRGLAICYNNVGNIYLEQKNYPKALAYQFKGLNLRKDDHNQNGLSYAYYNIGRIYNAMRQPQKSKEWFEKSMQLAQEDTINEIIAANYNGLATMDSLNGDFKSAYENYIHYSQYKESLVNAETIKKITEAGLKYQFEKQEAINELQYQQDISETRLRWGIAFLIFLLLGISVFSFLLISRIKRKKERMLLQQRNQIVTLEKEKVANQLKQANDNLNQFVKKVQEKNRLIDSISSELAKIKDVQGSQELQQAQSLNNLREMQILTDEDWMRFLHDFNVLYPKFTITLKQFYPKITTSELRYLMLSKIGLEHKQMANTLGVSTDTVRVTWNRVRHKLGGHPEDTPQSLMERIDIRRHN